MKQKSPSWGCNLAELMELFDLSVDQLSNRAGISRQTIYTWLRDPQLALTAKTAAKLAGAFGLPYYKIFTLISGDEE